MRSFLRISVFLTLLIAASAQDLTQDGPPQPKFKDEEKHWAYLQELWKEASAIKPGMTRSDLLATFVPDGGMQELLPKRYVMRHCPYVKVIVEFDRNEPANPPVLDRKIRIKSLSELKFEPMFLN